MFPHDAMSRDAEIAIIVYEQLHCKGHYAGRTRPMLKTYGYAGTIARLVNSKQRKSGLVTMKDRRLLDMTFEAVALRPPDCFDQETLRLAAQRLA